MASTLNLILKQSNRSRRVAKDGVEPRSRLAQNVPTHFGNRTVDLDFLEIKGELFGLIIGVPVLVMIQARINMTNILRRSAMVKDR